MRAVAVHDPASRSGGHAPVSLTVHISLGGDVLPPAALDLIESLRALADAAGAGGVTGIVEATDGADLAGATGLVGTADPAGAAAPEPAGGSDRGAWSALGWPGTGARREPGLSSPRSAVPATLVAPGRAAPGDPAGPALRVYVASRAVFLDDVPVRLTRREYDLLLFLCKHPRRVFTRPQLLRQVWGYEMVSGERTVDVHVRRLRVKLGGRGPVIATVRGVGYRLEDSARVSLVAEPT